METVRVSMHGGPSRAMESPCFRTQKRGPRVRSVHPGPHRLIGVYELPASGNDKDDSASGSIRRSLLFQAGTDRQQSHRHIWQLIQTTTDRPLVTLYTRLTVAV